MVGYSTLLLHQLSSTHDMSQTNPRTITCVALHKIVNIIMHAYAYANAMQLWTKHLRCYRGGQGAMSLGILEVFSTWLDHAPT
jgi:hypothetical protein